MGKADNRGRYQFGRKIFDAARQEFLAPALRQGPPRDKCHADNIGLGLWANWLQKVGKDRQRVRAYPQGMLQKTGLIGKSARISCGIGMPPIC